MPVMEISIVPVGTKTASLSKYVADVIKILNKEKDIKYKLTAMGTIVEANSVNKLLDVARKMHEVPFNKDIQRVVTSIVIDDRKDKKITIQGKVDSVSKKI